MWSRLKPFWQWESNNSPPGCRGKIRCWCVGAEAITMPLTWPGPLNGGLPARCCRRGIRRTWVVRSLNQKERKIACESVFRRRVTQLVTILATGGDSATRRPARPVEQPFWPVMVHWRAQRMSSLLVCSVRVRGPTKTFLAPGAPAGMIRMRRHHVQSRRAYSHARTFRIFSVLK